MLTPQQEFVSKILKTEKGDSVPLIIGFGYEKEMVFQKKRGRKSIGEITSYENFGDKLLK